MKVPNKVFIGGTGRSGSTILADTLRRHKEVYSLSEPLYFVEHWGGVVNLINGSVSLDEFKERLISDLPSHWERQRTVGFSDIESVYTKEAVSDLIRSSYSGQNSLLAGSIKLIDGLHSIVLEHYGKSAVVTKEPHSIKTAGLIYQMFPNMKYIHCVREPKDVLSSLITFHIPGLDSLDACVAWYVEIMELAFVLRAAIPDRNYICVSLEKMMSNTKELLAEVFDYIELEADSALLERLATLYDPDLAHIGRWKHDMPDDMVMTIDDRCGPVYRKWLDTTIGL